jgi:hypothetical protein
LLERIEPGGIERDRVRGSLSGACPRTLAGIHRQSFDVARDIGATAYDLEVERGLSISLRQPDVVLTSRLHEDRPSGRVDLQLSRARRARPRDDAPAHDPHHRLGKDVHCRLLIQLHEGAVPEEHLRAAVFGPDAIAGDERRVAVDFLRGGLVLDQHAAFRVGEVSEGRCVLSVRTRGGTDHQTDQCGGSWEAEHRAPRPVRRDRKVGRLAWQ